ncbi:MAG: type II secretion system F family protein [Azospirillaceae bacterium]|nr:type II secretion system F family protein [Azospirillaceae bacterium]
MFHTLVTAEQLARAREELILGLILLVLALFALLVALVVQRRARLRQRLGQVARFYHNAGTEIGDEVEETPLNAADLMAGLLRSVSRVAGHLNIANDKEQQRLRVLLQRAGYRQNDAVRLFMAGKLLAAASLAVLSGIVGLTTHMLPDPTYVLFVIAGGGLLGGMGSERVLTSRAKARGARINRMLPDALDLLIICTNAGYTLDLAITRVGREIARAAPDLSDEFLATSQELRLMSDRRQALENLSTRCELPAMRSLVTTLIQAQRYGTPLSQAMRTLAAEIRNTRLMAMEERAARIPAMITLPLMGLILPALFIVVGGPAFLSISTFLPH